MKIDKEELLHDLEQIQLMLQSFDFQKASIFLTLLINSVHEVDGDKGEA